MAAADEAPTTHTGLVPPVGRLISLIGFALAIAGVPAGYWPGFGGLAVITVIVARATGVDVGSLVRRLPVATPVVLVAAVLPVVAEGPGPSVAGVQLSSSGIEAAWTLVCRVALGVAAATILISTTTVPQLAGAAGRLRVPPTLLTIAMMMLRYVHVVNTEFDRARRSMAARGVEPRWFWEYGPVAAAAGTLFVRSYERGERVHGAMVSRGFDGTLPTASADSLRAADRRTALMQWLPVIMVIGCSWAVAALGHLR